MSEALSLERVIDQQINLGHNDPREFPELLKRALGEELIELAMPHLDDFIKEMARHRIGAQRRASVAKITSKTVNQAETLTRSMWVPSKDGSLTYKVIGKMTAEDFEARADYLDRMIMGIATHAHWCRDCAQQIRAEGVKTARQLSSLPALPELL